MNRLTKAWKALRGTLESEVREVEVCVDETTLYKVVGAHWMVGVYGEDSVARILDKHYPSCEAAFAAIDGNSLLRVERVPAFRIGSRCFRKSDLLEMGPKPKRPKGRA